MCRCSGLFLAYFCWLCWLDISFVFFCLLSLHLFLVLFSFSPFISDYSFPPSTFQLVYMFASLLILDMYRRALEGKFWKYTLLSCRGIREGRGCTPNFTSFSFSGGRRLGPPPPPPSCDISFFSSKDTT